MNELDQIYLSVDALMTEGRLKELDLTLSGIPVETTSTDLLLGYLTATLPVKSRLPARSRLYESVRQVLMAEGYPDVDDVLKGLK